MKTKLTLSTLFASALMVGAPAIAAPAAGASIAMIEPALAASGDVLNSAKQQQQQQQQQQQSDDLTGPSRAGVMLLATGDQGFDA